MYTDAQRQKDERDQKVERYVERANFFLAGVLVTLIGTLGSRIYDAGNDLYKAGVDLYNQRFAQKMAEAKKPNTAHVLDYRTDRAVGGTIEAKPLPSLVGTARDLFHGRVVGDNSGSKQKIMHLPGVYFDYQSPGIWSVSSQETIKTLATAFKEGKICRGPNGEQQVLVIIGHADPKEQDHVKVKRMGTVVVESDTPRLESKPYTYQGLVDAFDPSGLPQEERNKKLHALSLARARAAGDIMSRMGVLTLKEARGGMEPLIHSSNTGPQGNERNRRVEYRCDSI
jgi:outer membrane protein OmpA-like peptidoglycan-associated protein